MNIDDLIAIWYQEKKAAQVECEREVVAVRVAYGEKISELEEKLRECKKAKSLAVSEVRAKWERRIDALLECPEVVERARADKATMGELAIMSFTSSYAETLYQQRIDEADELHAKLYTYNRRAIAEWALRITIIRKFSMVMYPNKHTGKHEPMVRVHNHLYKEFVAKHGLPPLEGKNPRRMLGLRGNVWSFPSDEHMDRYFPIVLPDENGNMRAVSHYDLPDSFTCDLWVW